MIITKEIESLKHKIINKLDELKAENIEAIDVTKKTQMTDYVIIATGRSSKHIDSILDVTAQMLKQEEGIVGIRPKGTVSNDWSVLDAGDIIVHVFTEEGRQKYRLEDLWK